MDIENANKTIKTTDIKGKDYAEVNQRIKAFRMVYPTGSIITEMLNNEDGVCIFKAQVGYVDEDGEYCTLGTGTAYEKENSTFINKTSYIENCETSAVGRALGMCGFGIDVSVASYEEVQNAINNQEEPKISPKQIKMIDSLYTYDEIETIIERAKVEKIEDLTVSQASALISKRAK
jgi:hypothetical protein